MSTLTDFYKGKTTDHAGRMLSDYWRFDDAQLEREHGYIQWMFPLPVGSKYNKEAPILMPGDIAEFRTCEARFSTSLHNMMGFYSRTNAWKNYSDHNHLRITRILKCMRILYPDRYDMALRFFHHVMVRGNASINPISKKVWFDVIAKPVYSYADGLDG